MATAYEFTGAAGTQHTWGPVQPGDVAYFEYPPIGGEWREIPRSVEPASVGEDGPPESGQEQTSGNNAPPSLERPNKAASADEWRAYARAEGGFPGDVETATRKAIVDHYTSGGDA